MPVSEPCSDARTKEGRSRVPGSTSVMVELYEHARRSVGDINYFVNFTGVGRMVATSGSGKRPYRLARLNRHDLGCANIRLFACPEGLHTRRALSKTTATRGDPHRRWPFERRAVLNEWWPVHHGVAGAAVPGGVSAAAVTEAGDVTDEDLFGPRVWPLGHRPASGEGSSRHDASDQTAVTYNVDNVPSRDSVEVRRGIVP